MHRQITNEFNEARECSSRVAIRLKELRSELFDTVKKGRDADTTLMQWQRNQFQLAKSKYEAALEDYMAADGNFRTVKENRTRRLAKTSNHFSIWLSDFHRLVKFLEKFYRKGVNDYLRPQF